MALVGFDDDGDGGKEDEAGGFDVRGFVAWMDGVLPLITFVVERGDNQILVTVLTTVLALRGLAGFIAGRRSS